MIRSAFILLFTLTTCSKDETVSGQTDTTDVWVLSEMNKAPVNRRITIAFPKEGRISGQAPCNKYFGSQTVPMPWFEIKGLGSTKMACPELTLETQYFDLLQKMATAEVAGNTLILQSDDGNQMLVYKNN
jgi:heat shock protein HslJ